VKGESPEASAMRIGRYTVLEELGAGGMGRVRLAAAPDGRRVVLKTVLSGDPDDDERLRDEARVGLRLAHPHIVETVDCFEHEGRPVLATVYVPGATVLELRQRGPLPAAAVARMGRQIADALAAIHECSDEHGRPLGVLHRDVTGGNVLVDGAGDARLIDLGIARSRDSRALRTETGMLRGTLRYLAPELFDVGVHSVQSDLWALGVVLWEALLGRPAVQGSDAVAVGRICVGDVMALEEGERPDPRLVRAIARLLQRRPGDRPRRARDTAALFAMVQRELADDGKDALARSVDAALGTGPIDVRAACGLQIDDQPLASQPTDRHQPSSREATTTAFALPPTVPGRPASASATGDVVSTPTTPTQGLLDYAARLTSMERSLSRAWATSEQHSRESLRGLEVITGRLLEDTAPSSPSPPALPTQQVLSPTTSQPATLPLTTSPVPTPAPEALRFRPPPVSAPGLAPTGLWQKPIPDAGHGFPAPMTLPPLTPVAFPVGSSLPSPSLQAVASSPTRAEPDVRSPSSPPPLPETGLWSPIVAADVVEATPATGGGLALQAPLQALDELAALRVEVRRTRRLAAALGVVALLAVGAAVVVVVVLLKQHAAVG
jgi:serine/threonine protein kinase